MRTIQIETCSKHNFETKFNLFAKKVGKMGLEKPTFKYGDTYNREKTIYEDCEGEKYTRIVMLEVVDVILDIDSSYKLNGWDLVSVVLFQDQIVLPIDVNTVPPVELGLDYNKCDHCGGNHNARRKSFIVKNGTTFKQVGSTCSKEFLGMSETNITNLQVMFTEVLVFNFNGDGEDWDDYSRRSGRDRSWLNKYSGIEMEKVMSVLIPEVSEFGYEKQKFAQKPVTNYRGAYVYDHNGDIQYENDLSMQLNKETATINKLYQSLKKVSEDYKQVDFSEFIEYVNNLKLNTYSYTETVTERVELSQDNWLAEIKQYIQDGVFEKVEYHNGFDSSLQDIQRNYGGSIRTLTVSGFYVGHNSITITECCKFDKQFAGGAVTCTFKTKEIQVSGTVEDFNYKLQKVANQKMIMNKDLSVLSAGYASFLKFKSTPETKFVGTVGQKEKLTLTVTDIKTGNGQFGTWTLFSFVDEEGNNFTKFGTVNPKFSDSEEVKVGSVIKATFEIKEHKEFNGVKRTALGRLSK
jgi:hypothetical protein